MQFRILGALEVEVEDGPVAVSGGKRRALLARLLVGPNQPVAVDRLAHDLWLGDPPAGAASTLASHVSLLRKTLGPGRLEHRSGGYCVVVDAGELDAVVFESELALGQRSLRQSGAQGAADHLVRALGLWRGPALADVADAPWAQGEIARLEELRLGAQESLLQARLELGHHQEISAEAEAAAMEQPLREQRWATYMLALYRSGRQADALRAFRRLRSLLDEELGVEPSPVVTDLEHAIVMQSPELLWLPSTVERRGDQATGRGDVVPVRRDGGPDHRSPDRVGGRGGISGTPPGPDAPRLGVPLVDRLTIDGVAFVGRTHERARLSGLFANAAGGQRELVLVGGEPGIGKSTLAAVVARQVDAAGGTVLYGRCLEDSSAPYQPFVEALDHYVRHAPSEVLESHVMQFGGELSRLVPALTRRVPHADPPATSDGDTERYLAFSAATGLVSAVAHHRPVLLVLEDLHWADTATLQLLRHLVAHSQGTPMLVLGTFRSSETTPDHALSDTFAALWREANVTRIDLEGLSRHDVEDLCASYEVGITDRDAVASFAQELRDETAGNPFFVCELLRHLAESGDLARRAAEPWSGDQGLLPAELPTSLREVIGQRVRHLGTKAERVLAVAAVVGVQFSLATLSQVAEMDPEALLDILERAELASLLGGADEDGFVFAHALIRRTLYQGLLPARRRRLHARVAAALEEASDRRPVAAVIAHHYLAAGEQEPALRWTERAGVEALDAMAPDEAARWFEQACALIEHLHPGERLRLCDLTIQHGSALLLAGQRAHRDVLLGAVAIAKAAGDGRRMALAALANTRGYYSAAGQIDQERVDALRDALELVVGEDDPLRARLIGALCSETVFGTPLTVRRSLAHEAKSAARAVGDPRTIVEVNNLVIESLRYPTELAERLEDTEVALGLAERLHDPAALFWAISHRMRTLVEAGRVVEGSQHFDRMVELSGDLDHPVMRWMVTFSSAQWAFLRGQTALGEQLAEEAYGLGEEIGQPDAFNYYATQLSHARWQQGRLHEIVDLIAGGAEENPGIPAYQGALSRALCQAGQTDEAGALLDRATAGRFSDLPKDLLWTYGMATFAEVAVLLEHADAAGVLYDLMVPFQDQVSFLGTTCEGPMSHYLGGLAAVLGEFEAAERHFGDATRFAALAGSPYFCSRTCIESGRSAVRRGQSDVARRLLGAGRDQANQWGFAAEVSRAEEALARLT